ncbi:MAG: family 78 glycoside hydrolase catalytic domain [Ferruginibacter sp.]
MRITITFILVILSGLLQNLHAQVTVENLRCEMLSDPEGIDVSQPRFSWQLQSDQRNVTQVSYQLMISSTEEKLKANNADVWNSGKINSDQSLLVSYSGKKLQPASKYFWKVKVITNKAEAIEKQTAFFSTGLSAPDWKAKWIGYDRASSWDSITTFSRLSARYFRKEFQSSGKIKRATVYVCGLGLYELFINEKKMGDHVLSPAPTDYRKSVLYNTYDVTASLQSGNNAIGIVLGNGRFFTMRQNYKPQKINTFGFPKMLLQLMIEYEDGTKKIIVSDESWKLNVDGPIRTDNEYDGEEYDATKELTGWNNIKYDDSKWLKPELVKAPSGKLKSEMSEPMKVMRIIQPVSIKKINDKKFVLDMGQNFAGWIKMKVKGNAGDKVTLRFAESVQPNGELYVANLRDAKVTDVYTLRGSTNSPLGEGGEEWHPTFVYHGFRYVEINNYPGEPLPEDFEGQMVYDNLSTIGSFNCSDTIINRIVQNAWWGIASDYKGMPVDCPQRNERQPWLGDRATGCTGESFLFNNSTLYAKWLDDIEQSQTAEGSIPDVAPAFWNYYTDNVTWPGTYILAADMLHQQFADEQSIVKHYASMKKWMSYMKDKFMKDFIITKDKYGDWCVPPESLELIRSKDSMRNTNGALIATAYYYHLLEIMKRFAVINHQSNDTAAFELLAKNIRNAFNSKFFNNILNQYDNNTITANLLPLYFGMVPDDKQSLIFNKIYKKLLTDKMHISTGVIGTQWLMRGLTTHGKTDAAYDLASNTSYPGWGYMVKQGATTIWELWNGNTASPQMNSQNHVMLLGDLLIWLFEDIGGIKSDNKAVAFKQINMRLNLIDELYHVNAGYESPYGKIISQYQHQKKSVDWKVTVPANTSAILKIPATADNIMESGMLISKSKDIKVISSGEGITTVKVGSGTYVFNIKPSGQKLNYLE